MMSLPEIISLNEKAAASAKMTHQQRPREAVVQSQDQAGFEIICPNGCRVTLPAEFDPTVLQGLLRLLSELNLTSP